MSDRGILFSAPMVLALLVGTKTQTRRVVKPQPAIGRINAAQEIAAKLRIQPGDRLWVREAWRSVAAFDRKSPSDIGKDALDEGFDAPWGPVKYEADGAFDDPQHWEGYDQGRLRPGMFMPRWASRITLHVTDVRVQRLQEISEADALAEGIEQNPGHNPAYPTYRDYMAMPKSGTGSLPDARASYRTLWEHINGAGSWANPWVTATTFTVERCNIDSAAP